MSVMEMRTTSPVYGINSTNGTWSNSSEEYVDHSVKDERDELRWSLKIFRITFLSLAFVLGVLGNGVVIWVTGFKMKKTVNTVWFLNLAVADFLFTAFRPLNITSIAMDSHWPFGTFMCKLNSALIFLNLYASVYILVVISVDRCVSVVWPVWTQNHRNVRKASYVSLCVWLLSLILSSPYFVYKDTRPSHTRKNINCFKNFYFSNVNENPSVIQLQVFRRQVLAITRFLMGFVVPFTVIVSCYTVIIHRLRRNRALASQSTRPFKIIAAIIITFFLCWAPSHIMVLIELMDLRSFHQTKTSDYVFRFGRAVASFLVCLNSCLNPLLYVFMGQDFKDKARKSILKVLEAAFQEEETRSHTLTKSVITRDESVCEAEL